MLLLTPLLKSITSETKKPNIIILEDKSLSIEKVLSTDETAALKSGLDAIETNLSVDYEVSRYPFNEKIITTQDSSAQSDKITNISTALEYAYDIYNDQNLGAIILATDGIFNEGKNPLYQNLNLKAPIHIVGLGDTIKKRDISIKHVFFNKIAYLGDKFNIQVDVQGNNAKGTRSTLSISKETSSGFSKLAEKAISINSNQFFKTETFTLDANTAGVNRYRLRLSGVSNESSSSNNVSDFYIEVLDARQKIVIYANAPHPDVGAISDLIGSNKNYEVDIKYAKEEIVNPAKYDFFIFHSLPSNKHDISKLINTINQRKTPRMFIAGAQTNLSKLNAVQNTLNIQASNVSQNEVQPILQDDFSLFTLEDGTKSGISNFVPMLAPYGKYSEGPSTETLLYQRIGNVDTQFPLISFSETQGQKTAILAAEGIWKWRLFNYLQYDNHDILKDILNKTITYTSVKEDKRKFRVTTSKNLYKENERIFFDAELYNNSYQLTNEPDASITLKNADGKEFPFTMTRKDNYYTLDAGKFAEGNYRYNASLNNNGEVLKQSGKFTVQSIQLEMHNLTADHQMLNELANKYGGNFYTLDNLNGLTGSITSSESIKPVLYSTTSTKSIIHYKWIFVVLILLLILEWFLRRYWGSY